jgi:DNA repair protein RecO (recombination protein O)
MVTTTEAIVLHKLQYSETSIIVHVFTPSYGRISLIVGGVKKSKSRNKSALFEPMNILQVTANFKTNSTLIRPSELKIASPLYRIQSEMKKRSIALFLAEVIYKSFNEPHPEPQIFQFIKTKILELEENLTTNPNFHIQFLFQYAQLLGIQPQSGNGTYFDMEEGQFTSFVPSGPYLANEVKEHFRQYLEALHFNIEFPTINSNQRKNVLHSLVHYFQIHLPQMQDIKSHLVLEAVFA